MFREYIIYSIFNLKEVIRLNFLTSNFFQLFSYLLYNTFRLVKIELVYSVTFNMNIDYFLNNVSKLFDLLKKKKF